MADILSQEEIDALLDVCDEDEVEDLDDYPDDLKAFMYDSRNLVDIGYYGRELSEVIKRIDGNYEEISKKFKQLHIIREKSLKIREKYPEHLI